ncbi:MAG: LysM peptidoglycan-binding domain-containing protein [Bacteroidota bacterium]|nr:LysM peptidoglycan-binding domain-containing protein [Bacteroidota bacterium]
MRNLLAGLFCLIMLVSTGLAQHAPLHIEGTAGKFYLIHTVTAKENWYSIGRLYNASPHDLATYNNMSFDKPLDIGQQINIPLTTSNFDQRQRKGSGEALIPIYHTVQEKEWAFRLSSIYNDVPVSNLEKWNKLKRDDVKQGMELIVGFLKVKTDQSYFASNQLSTPVQQPPAVATVSAEKPKETRITDRPEPPVNGTTSKSTSVPPVSTASSTSGSEHTNIYAASHASGGFFSISYLGNNNKSFSGQAGTFKSTSGWTDGKYYALMNGVPVGTIIRISSSGKIVYAKVLGQLPEMKESNGLLIRISNAASAELGTGEGRFSVDVRY